MDSRRRVAIAVASGLIALVAAARYSSAPHAQADPRRVEVSAFTNETSIPALESVARHATLDARARSRNSRCRGHGWCWFRGNSRARGAAIRGRLRPCFAPRLSTFERHGGSDCVGPKTVALARLERWRRSTIVSRGGRALRCTLAGGRAQRATVIQRVSRLFSPECATSSASNTQTQSLRSVARSPRTRASPRLGCSRE